MKLDSLSNSMESLIVCKHTIIILLWDHSVKEAIMFHIMFGTLQHILALESIYLT